MIAFIMVFAVVSQASQAVRTDSHGLHFLGANEVVMTQGMRITAKTKIGTISITALNVLTRAYTWEGATRTLEMDQRGERWYGHLDLYYPGPGDHWEPHNGISRAVVEEGQEHLKSVAEFQQFLKQKAYLSFAYRNDGLFVGWGKVLERRQLNVEVWQILIHGHKPRRLPGARSSSVTVSQIAFSRNPLMNAIQTHDAARVNALLKRGANPNSKDEAGLSPLVVAVRNNDLPVAKALLAAKANPNVRLPDGTPLLCEALQNEKMAELLLASGADPNLREPRGISAGQTALDMAALAGPASAIRLLMKYGADPNLEDSLGTTPFMYLASGTHESSKAPEVLQILLDAKADINHQTWNGLTALMMAAMDNDPVVVRFLLDHGADPNLRVDVARALITSAGMGGFGAEEREALESLEKSGRLNTRRFDGNGALDYASKPEVRKILMDHGAKSFVAEAERALEDLEKELKFKSP